MFTITKMNVLAACVQKPEVPWTNQIYHFVSAVTGTHSIHRCLSIIINFTFAVLSLWLSGYYRSHFSRPLAFIGPINPAKMHFWYYGKM